MAIPENIGDTYIVMNSI